MPKGKISGFVWELAFYSYINNRGISWTDFSESEYIWMWVHTWRVTKLLTGYAWIAELQRKFRYRFTDGFGSEKIRAAL